MKYFLRPFSSLPLNHSRRAVVSYKGKHVHKVLVHCLFKLAQEKSMVRCTECPAMTIAVDFGSKETKKTPKNKLDLPHKSTFDYNFSLNSIILKLKFHQIKVESFSR